MINFKGVKLSMGTRTLSVGDIDLSGPGSIAIIGVNGAGKTTLLRALMGLLKPAEGEILLEGRNIQTYSKIDLAVRMSYVPQVLDLPFYMSAIDFMLTASISLVGLLGIPGDAERALATKVLSELNAGHLCNRNIATLSGGEMRIVALARALYQAPTCVLDEVYAPLDIRAVLRVNKNIRDAVDKGNLVIYTTHDIQTALCADKVLLLYQDGTVELRPKNGISNMMLKRVYAISFGIAKAGVGLADNSWVTHKIL